MSKKIIAVVLVTYNGEDWLDTCILPLYKVEGVKLIVVDNCSTDKTVEKLKQNYPDIILIESEKNLGFGKANNLGFDYAITNDFEYVFLLNQDASINSENLFLLVNEYSKIENIGILSPIHYKNETEIENLFQTYLKNNNITLEQYTNSDLIEIQFVNAALWLISVENLKRIGGFNPIFFHYGEDVEFVNRINFFNKKTYISLNTKGYHFREYDKNEVRKKYDNKVHFGPWHHRYYIILLNNNYNATFSFYVALKLFLISIFKHLIKGNFFSVKWDFKIFIDVLKKYPEVKKSRNICENNFL